MSGLTTIPSAEHRHGFAVPRTLQHSADVDGPVLPDHTAQPVTPLSVTFTLPVEIDAGFAAVVGEFNDWDPTRGVMVRNESGALSCSLPLARGRRYQYRYLLDSDR